MQAVRSERDGPLLSIVLARPERRNAFDATVIGELAEAFAAVGDARVVVLRGDGPSFSAGADLEWMRASVELSHEENVADAERLRALLEAIDGCPAPVVARVHGHALGGGAGLVAASDIAIAAPDAVFGFTETVLGLVPAVISPFVRARMGHAARRYFVTAERFDAGRALAIGLVDEVADDPDAAVQAAVAAVLAGGPEAVRDAKLLARGGIEGRATSEAIARRRASAEGQEGVRAVLERRARAWRGE